MQEGEEQESSQSMIEAELSIHEFNRMLEQEQRREEILHFKERLKSFGLSFSDLLEHSPKHTDARQNAIKVAYTLVEHEELKKILFEKKQLCSRGKACCCPSMQQELPRFWPHQSAKVQFSYYG